MPASICLIVPCFNEAARIDFDRFARLPPGVKCLMVDDGSSDGTAALIERHLSDTIGLLALPANVGKAEAIRQGMLHARTSGRLAGVEWIGYWDADLATPLSEIGSFLAYAQLADGRVEGVLGSRIYKLGSHIVRSYPRHLLGRLFATVAATLLDLECYDSQCGAKLFRTELLEQAFVEPFLSRWIFDVELLVRLRGRRLIEYPLREWTDVGGSKLDVLRVAWPTVRDLIRIRRRYGRGR